MNNPFSIHPPLSNIQAELLRLFSVDIPDKHLAELKKYDSKVSAAWYEKGDTDEKLREILNNK